MKKTPEATAKHSDDMRPEYKFDYRKARSNRFAKHASEGHVVVLLDPDIAEVFTTPESVKDVLRALIATMPPTAAQKPGKKRRAKA
jgi:hypothetical protein